MLKYQVSESGYLNLLNSLKENYINMFSSLREPYGVWWGAGNHTQLLSSAGTSLIMCWSWGWSSAAYRTMQVQEMSPGFGHRACFVSHRVQFS